MALFSLLSRLKWLVLVAAILKWMAFHVWVLQSEFGVSLSLSIWDSVVSNILLLGLSAGLSSVLLRYAPSAGKFWFALGLSFFLSWLWIWILQMSLHELAASDATYTLFTLKSYYVRWALGFFFLAGTSISSVFYYQLNEQKQEADREVKTLDMIRDAELKKLQLQLQPHFLFNSLNSINAMIIVNPDEARQMVQQLSEFLRVTTKRADEQWIAFSDEWQYVDLYLAIEKVRFGHRLKIINTVDEAANNFVIPTLMLQPLVENAIKFGLYGTADAVNILMHAEVKGELLYIKISNPYDSEMLPQKGSGFGLNGLRRRLYLLYARNDLLTTTTSENIFTVILKVPKKK